MAVGPDDEVAALRAGDEATFRRVVGREQATLVRVARVYVRDEAAALDVVQETWLAAIRGLDGFEGRSSLRAWLTGIAVNQARRRVARDARLAPVGGPGPAEEELGGWPERRFRGPTDQWPGHWASPPSDWSTLPEHRFANTEAVAAVRAAIETLPVRQRSVVLLRDVLGWTASEVCSALDLTDGNERVLLHRGRSTVRRRLAEVLAP